MSMRSFRRFCSDVVIASFTIGMRVASNGMCPLTNRDLSRIHAAMSDEAVISEDDVRACLVARANRYAETAHTSLSAIGVAAVPVVGKIVEVEVVGVLASMVGAAAVGAIVGAGVTRSGACMR